MLGRLRGWVVSRFGLGPIYRHALDRRVATGKWYSSDGATIFFLFMVQLATGATLGLSYSTSSETAYDSVRYITEVVPLGWFVRGLHYWSAGLMMVLLYFHVLRQILLAGYKEPREGTWLVGVVLFFGVHVLAFTGYTLRWDERAIYAMKVVLNMFHAVPLIGEWLVLLVQGGSELGGTTITRLFAVHAILLPLALLPLVGYHLYLVILRGITSQTEKERPVHSAEQQKQIYDKDKRSDERGETFYPTTMAKSGAGAAIAIVVAIALTLTYGPQRLYPEANLVGPSMPEEEWWFWWYSGLIAITPPWLAGVLIVGFPLLLLVGMLLLPLVDRSPHRGLRKRPVAVAFVVLCVLALVGLTELRRQSPWTGWPDPEPPRVPSSFSLAPDAEEGRQLFARYGCNSCHAIAGHGPRVGTDLARLEEKYSSSELENYILRPPADVAMPSYEGRMTDEELARVVAFVLVAQTLPREQ